MYIQLLAIKHIEREGMQRTYRPGDWVDVGKQTALKWIGVGEARAFEPIKVDTPAGCGVSLRVESPEAKAALAKIDIINLSVGIGHATGCERTLIYDPSAYLRLDLLAAGFGFLDRWQIAAPLVSYDRLACHFGTLAERLALEGVIHDLRVPCYDTRMVFVRRCSEVDQVLSLWQQIGGDDRLAFLSAVYQVKPLILALPITWMERR